MRTSGVQREVLASLALVMITANGLLAAVLLRAVDLHAQRNGDLLVRALLAESQLPFDELDEVEGARQWRVYGRDGQAEDASDAAGELDTIARAAREQQRPLVWTGRPWEALLFAAPRPERDEVAVVRVEPIVASRALLGLMLADALVFLGVGSYLLRRRLIVPLQALAATVHELGQGGLHARAQVRGAVAEVEQLGRAFDAMGEALERRTEELEKAVVDLRATNRDLRRAREGLDRAERLAAVGTLAAGVAHEVGNPMGAVLAFLDLTRREAEKHGFTEHGVDLIAKAARAGDRVRTILRQLLDFSRPPAPALRPLRLERVAEQAAALVRAQEPYRNLSIDVELADATPIVFGDESATSQILLNLALNAAQSVVSAGGSRVRLRVEPAPFELREGDGEGGRALASARTRAGAGVCRVEDDGPGIPAELRARVFDPFFTTKPPGEGTGLGLANALRLAEEQGGRIEVGASPELGGASVALVLRAADASDGVRVLPQRSETSRA